MVPLLILPAKNDEFTVFGKKKINQCGYNIKFIINLMLGNGSL